jgi:mono/diheme cytochrome c family protein
MRLYLSESKKVIFSIIGLSLYLLSAARAQSPTLFSTDQAKRGSVLFAAQCAGCHGSDLHGSDRNPALLGERFWREWDNQLARKLYSRIITSMPANDPGSLTEPEVIDLVAFVLGNNGVPVGDADVSRANELNTFTLHRP